MMALFPLHSSGKAKGIPDFDYPKTESKNALVDLNKAMKAQDGQKMIDAVIRYSLAEGRITRESLPSIVNKIDSILQIEKRLDYRALLYNIEARVLDDYRDYYGVRDRRNAQEEVSTDYTEWDNEQFNTRIDTLLKRSLSHAQALQQCPVTDYKDILKFDKRGAQYVPTLFEFLVNSAIDLSNNHALAIAWQKSWAQRERATGALMPLLYYYSKYHAEGEDLHEVYNKHKNHEESGLLLVEHSQNWDHPYQELKDYVARFPNGYFTNAVQNIIQDIEAKKVQLDYDKNVHTGDTIPVNIASKNVNRVTIKLYRVPDGILQEKGNRGLYADVHHLEFLDSRTVDIEGTVPFERNRVKTAFPPQTYGRYILLPEYEVNGRIQRQRKFYVPDAFSVFDMTAFSIGEKDKPGRIFVVDSKTGTPLSGVTVKNHFKGITGADGSVEIPLTVKQDNFFLLKGDDKYAPTIYYRRFDDNGQDYAKSLQAYTDLGIYRPGETVKFVAILYETVKGQHNVVAGEKIKATFNDTSGKMIDTLTAVTDAFGRIEGKFEIPADRMNGCWDIRFEHAQTHRFLLGKGVNVSEYKTPSFSIMLDDNRHSFTRKQSVKISGKAETYSGVPVANAEVELQLLQNEWSWWWRWQNSKSGELLSDTVVVTDAEGRFTVDYAPSLFDENKDGGKDDDIRWYMEDWHSYMMVAKVTNAAGETHEGYHNFIIGNRRGLNIEDCEQENVTPVSLPVVFNTTDENEKSVDCQYTLKQGKKVIKTGSFKSDKPTVDLTDMPSGAYSIEVMIAGDSTTRDDAKLVLYRKTDKQAPMDEASMWMPSAQQYVDERNVAHVLIGTSVPMSHIYYIASTHRRILSEGWLNYQRGLHDFKVQIPNEPNADICIQFFNTYHLKNLSKRVYLTSKINQQEISAKVTSFRNKLVPGTHEKWTFQLQDKHGNPLQGAMLLEMYDKALNDLSENLWDLSVNSYQYAINLYHFNQNYLGGTGVTSLDWQANRKDSRINFEIPELWLYNLSFFEYMSPRFESVTLMRANSLNSEMKDFDAGGELQEAVVVKGIAGTVKGIAKTESDSVGAGGMQKAKQGGPKNLDQVHVRQADVKTALWQPMLTSDAQGNITLEFEAPDFNTTWIMQAIGYTRDLLSDTVTREVLTQKPIMVRSSLPRFLRQGDKATLAASLMNATEEVQNCHAVIELFDPRTLEIYATRDFNEQLAAKGTHPLAIDWIVPDTVPFVGFRVKAANDDFGDGEQVMIPVLSAISAVIETKPFYVEAKTPSFKTTMPALKAGSRVTIEYCNNPVWYCVTALPTIFDNNYNVTTSLAHSLYAEVLAQGVAKAHPQIREAIFYWKAHEEDSTLVSTLAKNQDLKIGTLLASPWLREADRQTLRMSKLNELFDEKKMAAEHQKIIERLGSLQMTDGGFTWYRYPGCKSSLWATEVVLELVGELNQLGYLKDDADVNRMVKKAVKYYDAENLRLLKKQLKHSKNNYHGFSNYAYVRTMFKQYSLGQENASMMRNVLKAMIDDWKGTSLLNKAFYAMTLNRNNYSKAAQEIVRSIREFSITKPELGMYWDNLQDHWSYRDKVATTSTILQALNEVDPQKEEIDLTRKWILLMKQSNDWGSSSLAADAVYTILSTGSEWLSHQGTANITIDGEPVTFDKTAAYVGYGRKTIEKAKSGSVVSIERDGNSPAWGAVYCQFKQEMTTVKEQAIDELSIHKEYYTYAADGTLHPASATGLKVGDKVQVRVVIKNNKDMDYVTVADERGACFEPKDQLSGYRHADRCWYYLETKDSKTNLFFDNLQKGTHVISYDVYVSTAGTFAAGIATAQSQYAPQLVAHSAGELLQVGAR